jgi:hypothetical protein
LSIGSDVDVIPGFDFTGCSYDRGQIGPCRFGRLHGNDTPILDPNACENAAGNEQYRQAGNDHLPSFLQTNSPHPD